jgi:TolB-like protein/Tfp pilus assembly protein PilF
MSPLKELQRRNLHRAAAVYVGLAWLLIQVADTFFPAFGFGNAALRGLIIALAVGFVPAMVAAWFFELTPEGIKREAEIVSGSALEGRTNRLLNRLIVVLLALGLAYFAVDKFVLDPARDAELVSKAREEGRSGALLESYGEKSIVVLPFDNLSADPEQEYLSDGLAEEMLNLLAKIPELRVISRTSAFAYKGKDVNLRQIAEELDVAHVLEGSVRRSGNRLRITAQLIDARTDTHLWSEVYDRELADVFDIQDDIAGRVARELEIQLLGSTPKVRQTNPQAYLAFLEGRYRLLSGSDEDWLEPARLAFETAIELDPEYADAWLGLARVIFLGGPTPANVVAGGTVLPGVAGASDPRRSLDGAIAKAAALDPDNPAIAGFQGMVAAQAGDFARAAALVSEGVRRAPDDPDVLFWAVSVGRRLRQFEAAAEVGLRAIENDPRCEICTVHTISSLIGAGRYADAERVIDAYRLRFDRTGAFWHTLGIARLLAGDATAALAGFESAADESEGEPLVWHGRALAWQALGRSDDAQRARSIFESLADDTGYASRLAELDAWFGHADAAVTRLEPLFATQPPFGRASIAESPLLRKLDGHPGWEALLRRHGLSDAQLATLPYSMQLPPRTYGSRARAL